MAEVYGEKPKIFTKEWWPYFWLYYKWHTVAVLFVVMLTIISLVECANKEKYDLRITYLGQHFFDDSAWENVEKTLEIKINDIDHNNEKNIQILNLILTGDSEQMEQDYASTVKHDIEFSNELMYLFIYDKNQVEARADEFLEEAFLKTSEWLDSPVSDELLNDKDNPYAVSLKNSTILKNAGINCENLYVLVKKNQEVGAVSKAQENAIISANNLIK